MRPRIVTRDEYGGLIVRTSEAARARVVVRPYALGQYRIQLEIVRSDLVYPEILAPEC